MKVKMTARFAWRAAFGGCLLLLPILSVPTEHISAASITKPNILIIVTDDQRYGGFHVMPATKRWFKRGGTRFTQAYATTPLCCPSRSSIFTGRYVHNHDVHLNDDIRKLDLDTSIQKYLKEAGYQTAIAGKFFNFWPIDRQPPNFDRWAIFRDHLYTDVRFNVDGEVADVNEYSTDFISRMAQRYLIDFEQTDHRPWFLFVAPLAPHSPFTADVEHQETPISEWGGNDAVLEDDLDDKPLHVQNRAFSSAKSAKSIGSTLREKQLRTLIPVDDLVRDLFNTMGKLDERRPTLAFFMSDNGYLWGEHGLSGKGAPYRQSIRIPILIRWPGHLSKGARDTRLVANIDIAPTILDAAGIPPSSETTMDGKSLLIGTSRDHLLLEYWTDPRVDDSKNSPLNYPTWASLLTKDYQYIEYYSDDGESIEFREYYSRAEDPWQLVNVVADGSSANDPSKTYLAGLSQLLARERQCVGSECP